MTNDNLVTVNAFTVQLQSYEYGDKLQEAFNC